MSESKKYWYIKLRENFFDSDEITILESMDKGYIFSNILLKLYLRSLRDNGRLMFNNVIPYSPKMIATITRHEEENVVAALDIFQKLGLVEIMDSGAIYMQISRSRTTHSLKARHRSSFELSWSDGIPCAQRITAP